MLQKTIILHCFCTVNVIYLPRDVIWRRGGNISLLHKSNVGLANVDKFKFKFNDLKISANIGITPTALGKLNPGQIK